MLFALKDTYGVVGTETSYYKGSHVSTRAVGVCHLTPIHISQRTSLPRRCSFSTLLSVPQISALPIHQKRQPAKAGTNRDKHLLPSAVRQLGISSPPHLVISSSRQSTSHSSLLSTDLPPSSAGSLNLSALRCSHQITRCRRLQFATARHFPLVSRRRTSKIPRLLAQQHSALHWKSLCIASPSL